ncbi:MAG: hypothetical protein LBH37_02195 [Oscillospiraceae bacterium]|nr:hypothetical protein [Oscillospiraceae bacterium]
MELPPYRIPTFKSLFIHVINNKHPNAALSDV